LAAPGQVGIEDRLLADGEDLVAVLFLQQPGSGRAAGQMPCCGLNLDDGQPSTPPSLLTTRESAAPRIARQQRGGIPANQPS
jgi:hypothetical protein